MTQDEGKPFCGCGDEIVSADPGMCGACASMKAGEVERLRVALAESQSREAALREDAERGMTRERFESWISAPPYERSIERQTENGSWPGQYRSYETQASWEAWQESVRQDSEARAKAREDEEHRHETGRSCAIAIRARGN